MGETEVNVNVLELDAALAGDDLWILGGEAMENRGMGRCQSIKAE